MDSFMKPRRDQTPTRVRSKSVKRTYSRLRELLNRSVKTPAECDSLLNTSDTGTSEQGEDSQLQEDRPSRDRSIRSKLWGLLNRSLHKSTVLDNSVNIPDSSQTERVHSQSMVISSSRTPSKQLDESIQVGHVCSKSARKSSRTPKHIVPALDDSYIIRQETVDTYSGSWRTSGTELNRSILVRQCSRSESNIVPALEDSYTISPEAHNSKPHLGEPLIIADGSYAKALLNRSVQSRRPQRRAKSDWNVSSSTPKNIIPALDESYIIPPEIECVTLDCNNSVRQDDKSDVLNEENEEPLEPRTSTLDELTTEQDDSIQAENHSQSLLDVSVVTEDLESFRKRALHNRSLRLERQLSKSCDDVLNTTNLNSYSESILSQSIDQLNSPKTR